ncbi:heterokaryon incompatibility protein-domain-containing protein, partial [Cercophora newfieldiana]
MTLPAGLNSFCKRCKVLSFNDAAHKGFQATSAHDGEPQLRFHKGGERAKAFRLDFCLGDHYPDLPNLSKSSAEGCQSCEFIKAAILWEDSRRCIEDLIRIDLTRRSMVAVEVPRTRFTLQLQYWWHDHTESKAEHQGLSCLEILVNLPISRTDNTVYIQCPLEYGQGAAGRWLRLQPPIPSPLDGRVVEWMNSKLSDCLRHRHSTIRPPFCPDRLLDIRQSVTRLVLKDEVLKEGFERGSLKCSPRYAALSYCWGSGRQSEQLKTTKATLAQHRNGISDAEMTPVLRDAIRVAKALEIPYLWIDALCILQDADDSSDWVEQCQLMGSIYGSSTVTLRPLASRCCQEGFLTPKTLPTLSIPFQSRINPTKNGFYSTYVSHASITLRNSDKRAWDEERSVLETRGWALQESILPARVLSFGQSMIDFRCDDGCQLYGHLQSEPNLSTFTIGCLQRVRGTDQRLIHSYWNDVIVRKASRRNFTKVSDTLPALSGLAKAFRERLGIDETDYVAGMWKQNLLSDLMWTPNLNRTDRRTAGA